MNQEHNTIMVECMDESIEAYSPQHQNKMEGHSLALNSLLRELLDEKISTHKKTHWILGPEDLNDTLPYDINLEEAA
nr:smx5 isoform X2 [Misgurnus anguillicaudatus]